METNCVPFKFTINGQEIEAFIPEKSWELVLKSMDKNKTGYERVAKANDKYYFDNGGGYVGDSVDPYPDSEGNNAYKAGNYYTSKQVAENNVRADKLIRQLRRFAVEHRENKNPIEKYYVCIIDGILQVSREQSIYYFGPWFDSLHSACLAIEKFRDELMWYFTEYKDSL